MPGPIPFDKAWEAKREDIPEVVFEEVNKLIVENLRPSGYASFQQRVLMERLEEQGITRREALDKGWLDFEPLYEDVGWQVTYDKPGYNETYPATFTFEKP